MKSILTIFFKAPKTRPWLVLSALVFSAFVEIFGIGALIPTVVAISGEIVKKPNAMSIMIRETMEFVGLEHNVGNLILMVTALIVLKSIVVFGALSYASVCVARVATWLRRRLIEAFFNARWSYFSGQHAGRFANAVTFETTMAGDAYFYSAQFIAYFIQGLTYIIIGLLVNWKVAVAGLAVGVVTTVALGFLIRMTKNASFKSMKNTANLSIIQTDVMNNMKPLKTMHRFGPMADLMERTLRKMKKAIVAQSVSSLGVYHGTDAITALVIGVAFYITAAILKTPLSELVVLAIVFLQVISSINKQQKYVQNILRVEPAYGNVEQLIREAESEAEVHTGTRPATLEHGITFDTVSFAHGPTPIITDATLEIPAGVITVLQGPSGAGKTTLIDLLTGLYKPDTGALAIDGVPFEEIDVRSWRRQIGYVPQELNLLHASIEENITLGDKTIPEEHIWDALEQAGAAEFVRAKLGGLASTVGEMGSKLSGGQRQRISLARALVVKPKLLILDEVTSALDPETEREICENILSLEGRYTIIAITHRPAWTEIASRLYKVEAGRVSRMQARFENAGAA